MNAEERNAQYLLAVRVQQLLEAMFSIEIPTFEPAVKDGKLNPLWVAERSRNAATAIMPMLYPEPEETTPVDWADRRIR